MNNQRMPEVMNRQKSKPNNRSIKGFIPRDDLDRRILNIFNEFDAFTVDHLEEARAQYTAVIEDGRKAERQRISQILACYAGLSAKQIKSVFEKVDASYQEEK